MFGNVKDPEGARTYIQLQEHTKIGTVCGQCKEKSIERMRQYIEKYFSNTNKIRLC